MDTKIHMQPLGRVACFFDKLMMPIMYLLSGTFFEKPQQTHFWNNKKLSKKEVEFFKKDKMVCCIGLKDAKKRFWWKIPIFHIPIFGGWKDYIVLNPNLLLKEGWYVGWICKDVVGISQIKIKGSVRLLLGPGDVHFFGIDAKTNEQIKINNIGNGKIGDRGIYSNLSLL